MHASRFATRILIVACLTCPTALAAPDTRIVEGARVELGEVLPDAPPTMQAIDICAAPKVGSSRLLERQVIERQVRAAGFEVSGLSIPSAVRVERAGRKYTPAELGALLKEPVARALPSGVTLLQVDSTVAITLADGAVPRPITLPKLPPRLGSVRLAFAVEFEGEGTPIRVPVTAVVQISEHATRAEVTRGARLQLSISMGSARVAADATALADGNVGDEVRFRVNSTGKVLRGVILSSTQARVSD